MVIGYIMIIRRYVKTMSDCKRRKKISMNNAMPVRLIVSVVMFKERMKMQRGKEKRDPQ
jgi:hypothetical protein